MSERNRGNSDLNDPTRYDQREDYRSGIRQQHQFHAGPSQAGDEWITTRQPGGDFGNTGYGDRDQLGQSRGQMGGYSDQRDEPYRYSRGEAGYGRNRSDRYDYDHDSRRDRQYAYEESGNRRSYGGDPYSGGYGSHRFDDGSGFSNFNQRYGGRDFISHGNQGGYAPGMATSYGATSRDFGGGYAEGNRNDYGLRHRRDYDHDRGFLERAGDEVASWFGDEDAERRREMDHSGRGPSEYTRSDERIHEDACDNLTHDRYVDASDVKVSVSNGEITLDGHVDNRRAKRHAEDCIDRISGVRHVQNNLRVREMDRSDRTSGDSTERTTSRSATTTGRSAGTTASRTRETT